MIYRASDLASLLVGTRVRALDAWQRQIIRNTEQRRKVQADRVTHDRTFTDRVDLEGVTVNPNTLPPSIPYLPPTRAAVGPNEMMPPYYRNIVLARAALTAANNAQNIF